MSSNELERRVGDPPGSWQVWAIALIAVTLFVTFRDSLWVLATFWDEPEYSHGLLIPFISLYLLLVRLPLLAHDRPRPSWFGVLIVGIGVAGYVLGELSALYAILWYAFVACIWGIAVTLGGPAAVRVMGPALVFLLFMVPLPRFIQWNLSNELQLLSSELGGEILRVLGVPVFLEGNVIDLGTYKLQVVEACSGLRYLFPLMSFGLLCAVMYRGPMWQRAAIFASSVPIGIGMNSFRIAVTGILVNRFGNEAADGFLHFFEGWVIFTICLILLFSLMWLLAAARGLKLDDVFSPDLPTLAGMAAARPLFVASVPLITSGTLLVLAVVASFVLVGREEIIPDRAPLSTFPLSIGGRTGFERELGTAGLEELKLTDYTIANYRGETADPPVELYIAYYESQRKGASVHSPKACIPGGGWEIEQFGEVPVAGGPDGVFKANRVVMALGGQRMLVYYWFLQRGRYLTNEYLVKWFLFWDSLTMRRTDGALVRLVVPVSAPEDLAAAEAALKSFLESVEPRLAYHVPGREAQPEAAGAARLLR